ncbi:SipW-dependent-type signal peptide-containing protein [Archaeoglobus sp.]|uniref:SipW-dependent-type signal peptide-containing protein n=1 Tax=Archaeoglobus sp. TaxID=1872626 RepID=UPI0025B9EC20|nr:SipW-dependent-type signal peptide-containing protein [Archaeoglobus sp.]
MLVALGLVGATYAYWEDSLSITGTVGTGTLEVIFNSTATSSDNEETYDVGSVQCEVADDGKSATVTITNAYPGYQANCTFTIENTGTIPAKIKAINNDATDPLTVVVDGLNAGDVIETSKTFNVVTTVGQNAAEDTPYSYTITIDVGQFNE